MTHAEAVTACRRSSTCFDQAPTYPKHSFRTVFDFKADHAHCVDCGVSHPVEQDERCYVPVHSSGSRDVDIYCTDRVACDARADLKAVA